VRSSALRAPTIAPVPELTRRPIVGVLIVLTAASLFGTLGPLSRFAYEAGMEPLAFVGWRGAIAFLATAAFVWWRIGHRGGRLVRLRDLDRGARMSLSIAALMGFTLNFFMFVAFDRVTVALALLGFYTYPVMVAIGNVALGREPLDRPRVVALVLAVIGMLAVVASGYRTVPADQAMTVVLATTVVCCVALTIATGATSTLGRPIEMPSILPLLLFTGLFAAAIPSMLFLTGIRLVGGTTTGILMLFEPVVGVVLAAWLLAEGLAPIQVLGGLAILVAALILQRAAPAAPRVVAAPAIEADVRQGAA
jgi:drug/metabolite transporter (DMT)-like permease